MKTIEENSVLLNWNHDDDNDELLIGNRTTDGSNTWEGECQFVNIGAGARENSELQYIFGNENDIVSDMIGKINNENFCDNINEYYQLLYATSAQSTIVFSIKISGINVAKGVFRVGNESMIDNETWNGMFNFYFFIFFFEKCFSVVRELVTT